MTEETNKRTSLGNSILRKNISKHKLKIICATLTLVFLLPAAILYLYGSSLGFFEKQSYEIPGFCLFIMGFAFFVLTIILMINWDKHPKRLSEKVNLILMIIFISAGSLTALLIIRGPVLYFPFNPIGFLIVGKFLHFTRQGTDNLLLSIILSALSGVPVFYIISRLANRYIFRWIILIILYIAISALIFSSNFIDLGFKYSWYGYEYCRINRTYQVSDPLCPGVGRVNIGPSYMGLWIKNPQLVFIISKYENKDN